MDSLSQSGTIYFVNKAARQVAKRRFESRRSRTIHYCNRKHGADANQERFNLINQSRTLLTHTTFCSLARVAAGRTAMAFPFASTSKTNKSKLAPP